MTFISEYFVLISVVAAWTVAQILKLFTEFFTQGKFNLERIIGAGGMPSVHTASAVGLLVAIGRQDGISSTGFAIAFVLSFVVIYDAMNVRYEAGEHAKVLNSIISWLGNMKFPHVSENGKYVDKDNKTLELEEKLGHTIMEVIGGMAVGIIVPMLIPLH